MPRFLPAFLENRSTALFPASGLASGIHFPYTREIIDQSECPISFYANGIAFTLLASDVDVMVGTIAHEDFHCLDDVRFDPTVESVDEYRTEAELRVFKYQAQVLKSIGRDDLANIALADNGEHWRNYSIDDYY